MRKGQKSVESEDHPYFCSFFYFRRYFQSGVVGRYYFQRQAEADALTCIVMCVAASIERLEYMFYFFRRNADALIFYFKNEVLIFLAERNVYFLFRIFAGIIDDIL
mgnify:FL=1